jgi:Rnl2 family RNA ligase
LICEQLNLIILNLLIYRTMSFHSYTDLENKKGKLLTEFEKHKLGTEATWIATEKIHGANFSFVISETSMKPARRSDFLAPEESFFGWEGILEKYESDLRFIYNQIKLIEPGMETIQVFGELFGGLYPGFNTRAKKVQGGVYYSPNNEFMVFDIRVNTPAPYYMAYSEVQSMTSTTSLKSIPVSHTGKMRELAELNPEFQTTIPDLFSLAKVENNFAEGYVLRSDERHIISLNGSTHRPMMKLKNDKTFGEVKPVAKEKAPPEAVAEFIEDAMRYVTENRFSAVVSKIAVDAKPAQIQGLFLADVFKDYVKDLDEERVELLKLCQKEVKSAVAKNLVDGNMIETWMKNRAE